MNLRKLIGDIINGTNIDENILQALNYKTKEEYINFVTTDYNWCRYQEISYLSIKCNILIEI